MLSLARLSWRATQWFYCFSRMARMTRIYSLVEQSTQSLWQAYMALTLLCNVSSLLDTIGKSVGKMSFCILFHSSGSHGGGKTFDVLKVLEGFAKFESSARSGFNSPYDRIDFQNVDSFILGTYPNIIRLLLSVYQICTDGESNTRMISHRLDIVRERYHYSKSDISRTDYCWEIESQPWGFPSVGVRARAALTTPRCN